MPDLIVENETFLLDVDGFLKEPDRWSGPVAEALAKSSGIDELTDEHWNLINFIRDYWLKYGVAPTIRTFCRETGYAIEKIYDLFPAGPAKDVCRIAGLPKPVGCV